MTATASPGQDEARSSTLCSTVCGTASSSGLPRHSSRELDRNQSSWDLNFTLLRDVGVPSGSLPRAPQCLLLKYPNQV